jgi:hypothetical protein
MARIPAKTRVFPMIVGRNRYDGKEEGSPKTAGLYRLVGFAAAAATRFAACREPEMP